jgi:hypothetical protein
MESHQIQSVVVVNDEEQVIGLCDITNILLFTFGIFPKDVEKLSTLTKEQVFYYFIILLLFLFPFFCYD